MRREHEAKAISQGEEAVLFWKKEPKNFYP
jgi:hypothetical protein